MRASSFFPALLVTVVAAKAVAANLSPRQLSKRQTTEVCTDLTISSNNGDRKVVLVIDSSGSMLDYDPDDLRLAAARSLNDFLISNGEAGGERKADQVAVVGFDSSSYTVFPPGDPGDPAADEAISGIIADGGTYIASGVYEAIDHINAMPGDTKDRSAIVVFTDGSVRPHAGAVDVQLADLSFYRTLTRPSSSVQSTRRPALAFGFRLVT
jgi:Mg-chelatase subunit ChlD